MEAPKKIYVNIGTRQSLIARAGQTLKSDIEYIRKDALLEWAKERMGRLNAIFQAAPSSAVAGKYDAMRELVGKLNEL